jgi:drug/metabolite transporter (DMT)-like permease
MKTKILLGERLSPLQSAGAGVVITGIILISILKWTFPNGLAIYFRLEDDI